MTLRDPPGSAADDVRRWLRLALCAALIAIGVAGAVTCVAVCLLSCLPVRPVPEVVWVPLVLGIFPLVLGGFAINGQSSSPRDRDRDHWQHEPAQSGGKLGWILGRLVIAVIAFAAVGAVSGFVQLLIVGGQPEIIHGAYATADHGRVTFVSHSTYLWAQRAGPRMFGGAAFFFYLGCVAHCSDSWPGRRRRRRQGRRREQPSTRVGRTRARPRPPEPAAPHATRTRRYHDNPARRPPGELRRRPPGH